MSNITMFYRVNVESFRPTLEECGESFGRIEGRHSDYLAARKACDKSNNKPISDKQQVLELTTDKKLEISEVYKDICFNAYVEQNIRNQAHSVAQVIEKMKTGCDAEEACKSFYPMNEFHENMEFDDWLDRFSERAEKIIEEKEIVLQERASERARLASVVSDFSAAASEITYSLPAVKGIQANKEFYIAQVPFKYLVRFFTFADESVPPELRAQRKVNDKRAQGISNYVVNNRDDYILPAITVSVSAAMTFEPLSVNGLADRLGVLKIPVDATCLINDGQTRRKGAEYFLELDKSLKDETIPVQFFYDEGLARSKQMFADLNANISKPNAAINSLYDVRNPFNKFLLDALARHEEIDKFVDKENTNIVSKSSYIWSLIHWKNFVEKLLGITSKNFESFDDDQVALYNSKFDTVVSSLKEHLRHWRLVFSGEWDVYSLKEYNIGGHAVYLESLAVALSDLELAEEIDAAVQSIARLTVGKDNEHWNGRCVVAGKMVKNSDSVRLTAGLFREEAGLELTDSMKETYRLHGIEKKH